MQKDSKPEATLEKDVLIEQGDISGPSARVARGDQSIARSVRCFLIYLYSFDTVNSRRNGHFCQQIMVSAIEKDRNLFLNPAGLTLRTPRDKILHEERAAQKPPSIDESTRISCVSTRQGVVADGRGRWDTAVRWTLLLSRCLPVQVGWFNCCEIT